MKDAERERIVASFDGLAREALDVACDILDMQIPEAASTEELRGLVIAEVRRLRAEQRQALH